MPPAPSRRVVERKGGDEPPNFKRSATLLAAALLALVAVTSFVEQSAPIKDPDLFWHLKTGEWIWEHKALPAEDPFTYTAPKSLNAFQHFTLTSPWLSQIFFYLVHLAGGMRAIFFLKFVFTGFLLWILTRRRAADPLLLLSMLVFLLVVLGLYNLERPQTLSFILYALLLNRLAAFGDPPPEGWRRLGRAVAVPVLMLVWANLHGAYLLGQATIVLFMVLEGLKFLHPALGPMPREGYRRLLAAGALGLVFSLLNPNTYHAYEYLKPWPIPPEMWVNIEYQSTVYLFTRLNYYRIAAYWLLIPLIIIGLAARWRKPDITRIVLLAVLGIVSFTSSRYMIFFLIPAVPLAASYLSEVRIRKWITPVVIGLAFAVGLYFCRIDRSQMIDFKSGQWMENSFPEDEANFIVRNDLQGNMYNSWGWGGYLLWKLGPARKVFIDGRLLDVPTYLQSMHIDMALSDPVNGQPYWKTIFNTYDIRYTILPFFTEEGDTFPLVDALLRDPEWMPVSNTFNTVIFIKATPEHRSVIARYGMPKERYLDQLLAWSGELVPLYPDSVFLLLARGELLMKRGRLAEARKLCREVLQMAPFNATARERLQRLGK